MTMNDNHPDGIPAGNEATKPGWGRGPIRGAAAAAVVSSVFGLVAGLPQPAAGRDGPAPFSVPSEELAGWPADIIGPEELEGAGLQVLGDLFGDRVVYNAHGLYRAVRYGTVLVDGRPSDGFHALPLSAVERIEVYAPGTGPFAMGSVLGGVANIVLRRDFDGAEIRAGAVLPAGRGGDSGRLSAFWGGGIGAGRFTFGVHGLRRDEIRWADRDFSRSSWSEGGNFTDAVGISIAGNTLLFRSGGRTIARPLGDCSGRGYTGILANPASLPGAGCGFAYGDIGWETDREKHRGVVAGLDFPLGRGTAAYADLRSVRYDRFKRWAPDAGIFTTSLSGSARARLLADPEIDSLPERFSLYHRFTGHGNREWESPEAQDDLTLGLRGPLARNLDYDLSFRRYRNDPERNGVSGYVDLNRVLEEEGRYDPENPLSTDSAHQAAVRESSLLLFGSRHTRRDSLQLVLDGRFPDSSTSSGSFLLPGGPVRWNVGLEMQGLEEGSGYYFLNATDRSPYAGNTKADQDVYVGERETVSLTAGIELPLGRDWGVTLAARHDDHDDVGLVRSYRVSGAWRPRDWLWFRGSWQSGGNPPPLRIMHDEGSVSLPFVCDTAAGSGPLEGCDRIQVASETRGNPELVADNRRMTGLGVTALLGRMSLDVDWVRLKTEDGPDRVTPQHLINLEAAGKPLPPGSAVIREAGRIAWIINPWVNIADNEREAVDLRANVGRRAGPFETGLSLRLFHVLKTDEPVPLNRAEAVFNAGRGGVTASWVVRGVAGYDNKTGDGRYPSWVGHDLLLSWGDAFGVGGMTLRGGILNVGDRGVPVDSANPDAYDARLDSLRGRSFFLSVGRDF